MKARFLGGTGLRHLALILVLFAAALPGAKAVETSAASSDELKVRALSVLHQIMASEQSWVRIHAAEALISAGEVEAVRTYFLQELSHTESSTFRVGVYRVLATVSRSPEERRSWIAKVEQIYLDPTASDQNQAIETLCKLGYQVTGPTLDLVRRHMAEPPSAPMALALWAGSLARETQALEKLLALLRSSDPALRTSAAYALRWLHPVDPAVRQSLALALDTEPAGTVPYTYLLTAALAVDSDYDRRRTWEAALDHIMMTGTSGARFEASWMLKERAHVADLPHYATILDFPEKENDARVGAAAIILTTLSRL